MALSLSRLCLFPRVHHSKDYDSVTPHFRLIVFQTTESWQDSRVRKKRTGRWNRYRNWWRREGHGRNNCTLYCLFLSIDEPAATQSIGHLCCFAKRIVCRAHHKQHPSFFIATEQFYYTTSRYHSINIAIKYRFVKQDQSKTHIKSNYTNDSSYLLLKDDTFNIINIAP